MANRLRTARSVVAGAFAPVRAFLYFKASSACFWTRRLCISAVASSQIVQNQPTAGWGVAEATKPGEGGGSASLPVQGQLAVSEVPGGGWGRGTEVQRFLLQQR